MLKRLKLDKTAPKNSPSFELNQVKKTFFQKKSFSSLLSFFAIGIVFFMSTITPPPDPSSKMARNVRPLRRFDISDNNEWPRYTHLVIPFDSILTFTAGHFPENKFSPPPPHKKPNKTPTKVLWHELGNKVHIAFIHILRPRSSLQAKKKKAHFSIFLVLYFGLPSGFANRGSSIR